mgnify:FL=1
MNVPKLRFKEFNDEWQPINLADIFQYFSTNSLSREQLSESGILKNLHYGDIHRKYNSIVNETKEITSYVKDINYINKYELLKNNDLIFADASEDYEGIGKAVEVVNVNNNTVSGLHTILARDNSNVFAPMFKGYYFNSPTVHNQIRVLANGFKVYGISKEVINKLNIKIPSINEQSKIANTLYLLDEKIELQTKKIEDLKLFKLYTKNQIFKDCDEIFKLKDILVKWNKKNKNNSVKYVESINNKYGFISQSDQFEDRNVASKDLNNYYIIEKGVFGYNPSRLNVGSLALKTNDKVSVVSPLYECFTTSQNNQYLLEWFDSKYFRKETISKFEGGVRNTLNFSNLCEIEIGLPTIEKQNMYSRIFKIFNNKIEFEVKKLYKLQELKKGLLQSMFV